MKSTLPKSTFKINPLQLLAETVLKSNLHIFSLHLKSDVGRGCDMAHPYKLFASKYTRYSLGLLFLYPSSSGRFSFTIL